MTLFELNKALASAEGMEVTIQLAKKPKDNRDLFFCKTGDRFIVDRVFRVCVYVRHLPTNVSYVLLGDPELAPFRFATIAKSK